MFRWMQGSKGLTKPGVKPTRIEDRPITSKATAVPKWKAESEAFRAQLRNGRVVTDAVRVPPPRLPLWVSSDEMKDQWLECAVILCSRHLPHPKRRPCA